MFTLNVSTRFTTIVSTITSFRRTFRSYRARSPANVFIGLFSFYTTMLVATSALMTGTTKTGTIECRIPRIGTPPRQRIMTLLTTLVTSVLKKFVLKSPLI